MDAAVLRISSGGHLIGFKHYTTTFPACEAFRLILDTGEGTYLRLAQGLLTHYPAQFRYNWSSYERVECLIIDLLARFRSQHEITVTSRS